MEDNVTSDAVKDHPAGTGRNGKRVVVGVAAAVAVVLAVGGVCGYSAYENHRSPWRVGRAVPPSRPRRRPWTRIGRCSARTPRRPR